nr:hypothetical protein [uncultured Actinoplanes sp.]
MFIVVPFVAGDEHGEAFYSVGVLGFRHGDGLDVPDGDAGNRASATPILLSAGFRVEVAAIIVR